MENTQVIIYPSEKNFCLLFEKILQKYNCIKVNKLLEWKISHIGIRSLIIPKQYKLAFNLFLKSDCSQRFFATPIILRNNNSNSHIIMVIYDKELNCIEIFDPANNVINYDAYILEVVIYNTFSNTFNLSILEIHNQFTICKSIGIQEKQEQEVYKNEKGIVGFNIGFCTSFSLWYLEQRILFPYLRSYDIIENTINNNNSLTTFIQNYTKNLHYI